jgi:mono/diheme cytochrome c family protein
MKRLIVVLAGAALLAAPAFAQDNNTLKAIGQGRAVYLVHCASCHGADAKGTPAGTNGGAAPDLTLIAARDGAFGPLHVSNHIAGRHDGVTSGKTMPCWRYHFQDSWPGGEGASAMRVYTLAKYLAFVQEQPQAQRVASK